MYSQLTRKVFRIAQGYPIMFGYMHANIDPTPNVTAS